MILIFFLIFSLSFFGTHYVMPHSIRKLRETGYVTKDMYKIDRPKIPTNAGMIVLFVTYISIALFPLLIRFLNYSVDIKYDEYNLSEDSMAFLLVISIYALYGLVDDLVDIGRKMKLLLPIIFSFPLISVVNPDSLWFPLIGSLDLSTVLIGDITFNDILRVIIIPVYVMVVANLVNMHSGYNGLQSGLSIIILSALLIKSYIDNEYNLSVPGSAFLGSMTAFWLFNKYPSKVFEGNIGSLLFGSVIGCIIVIQEFWWFGFFILLPHTFNFILWIYWLFLIKQNPDKYLNSQNQHQKFGKVNVNGIIEVPNGLTLKWIPSKFFDLNEKQSVLIMYSVTIFFCSVGLIIF